MPTPFKTINRIPTQQLAVKRDERQLAEDLLRRQNQPPHKGDAAGLSVGLVAAGKTVTRDTTGLVSRAEASWNAGGVQTTQRNTGDANGQSSRAAARGMKQSASHDGDSFGVSEKRPDSFVHRFEDLPFLVEVGHFDDLCRMRRQAADSKPCMVSPTKPLPDVNQEHEKRCRDGFGPRQIDYNKRRGGVLDHFKDFVVIGNVLHPEAFNV
jgi:hypothetical protein